MSQYRLTVGLEIHAELHTRTKMFCACLNDPDEKEPNKNVCAVCLAHPGTLPVINQKAVHRVLTVGEALGGTLALEFSEFDRKNYFYPDIPKGYQLSQYKYPLVKGGSLNGVEITRVHLEEDTARSQHVGDKSLVDYNRAGVPLMELVTEPAIASAQEAGDFARELRALLRTLGAGEANMEKGQMRVEANISVSKDKVLGTKVEVKNLNSFRSVERAIAFELKRQSDLIESGGSVVQETRGWDEEKQETFSQRKKESSHDYRYFPDPDLPKLKLSEVPGLLGNELPELPWQRRERYSALGFLQKQDIEQLLSDVELANFFDATINRFKKPEYAKSAANYILNFIAGVRKDKPGWLPEEEHFVVVIESNLPSPQTRSSILSGTIESVSDAGTTLEIAKKIIDANPTVVADYKAGKEAALQFLVGQGMKESKGRGNPQDLREAILQALQ